jgi:DNA-binding NarL/FixJ family response regulator
LQKYRLPTSIATSTGIAKTCYRCGGVFFTSAARLCSGCRKPRVQPRKATINRSLTFREKQIVQLIGEAKLNKEIAFELHLTEGTIKEYLNRIFRKLDVKNRTHLAIWAMRNVES